MTEPEYFAALEIANKASATKSPTAQHTKHTPTPWTFDSSPEIYICTVAETSSEQSVIAELVDNEADAKFICRCVNSHAELLAALKAAQLSLKEAMEFIQEDIDNRDGRDNFGIGCGFCDGAIPVEHSFGCKAKTAIRNADKVLAKAEE